MTGQEPWWRGRRGEYYVVAQFIFLALVLVGPWWPWRAAPWPSPWGILAQILGLLLALLGAGFAFAGVWNLGRNLTAVPYPKDGSRLVVSGLYGLIRHPIYSGLILGSFGWGLLLGAPVSLAWAAALFGLLDIKSRREEAWLRERFPDYAAYQKRVRKLLPFIY